MNPRILNREFQHPADGWYQIEALGHHPNRAAGVVQVIDAEAAQSIVNRFNAEAAAGRLRQGHEMLIDHEHFSEQPDQETRAYGWLQELQNRADGIYGRIRWTSTGRSAVDGGDYRFFSTEYEAQDLKVLNAESGKRESGNKMVRPLRLDGLTLTNMNNNRGQKPITNRCAGDEATSRGSGAGDGESNPTCRRRGNESLAQEEHSPRRALQKEGICGQIAQRGGSRHDFAGSDEPAENTTSTGDGPQPPPPTERESMKSVCTLLGLSAEADEAAVHAAVARLLNRADIAPDALAALRAEHQSLAEQNQILLAEQSETLLDGCGVRDERLRNRLHDGMTRLKNRQERLGYLADFGYQPGDAPKPAAAARVLNRGPIPGRDPAAGALGEGEQAVALRIQNRAGELQGKGLKYDLAWNQARREILGARG
jgi:hypothetical protein